MPDNILLYIIDLKLFLKKNFLVWQTPWNSNHFRSFKVSYFWCIYKLTNSITPVYVRTVSLGVSHYLYLVSQCAMLSQLRLTTDCLTVTAAQCTVGEYPTTTTTQVSTPHAVVILSLGLQNI